MSELREGHSTKLTTQSFEGREGGDVGIPEGGEPAPYLHPLPGRLQCRFELVSPPDWANAELGPGIGAGLEYSGAFLHCTVLPLF